MVDQTPAWRCQGGFSTIKAAIYIGVIGGLVTLLFTALPAMYEYHLLKDLAKRVVSEYRDLAPKEVERRVVYEIQRARMANVTEDTFVVEPVKGGYRVIVDYTWSIPIPSFGKKGEEEDEEPTGKQFTWHFETES